VHVLQHVAFEGPGSIAPWLEARQAEVMRIRLFAGDPLPLVSDSDLLVVMGGPMSVNDELVHPWLREEKTLVREMMDAGVPVLGICLGAQVIASACAARVYPNAAPEIGWFPVQAVEGSRSSDRAPGVFRFPPSTTVFHWHGETFDLPDGARHLARSEACECQAFQIGRTVIGLQFHLEMTPEGAEALIHNCEADLLPGPYVQTGEVLRAVPPSRYLDGQRLMGDVLAYLLSGRE
jgi:GMP synthase-like glutamine amidotransferase